MRRGGSYTERIKNKKGIINSKNEDDKCITYAIIASVNPHKIDSHPERISKLKHHINDYNWHGLEFPVKASDWRKFEENNISIAINILFVPKDKASI